MSKYSSPDYDFAAERELWADRCRDNFWLFLNYGFGVKEFMRRNPQNQWLDETIHKPLCDWLETKAKEYFANREAQEIPMKLMIVWPRNCGKTVIVSKAFHIWCHLQDPDFSSVIDSVTTAKSWDFLRSIKQVISGGDGNAWFTKLYGNWQDSSRAWKAGYLVHGMRTVVDKSEASFETSSVEQGITGKHPDALFIDDPVVQEKLAEGGNWHEKVHTHCDAVIPALQAHGILVASATRYADDDWLGRYIRTEGVKKAYGMRMRELHLKPEGQWELYFMQARDKHDRPVFPKIHTEKFLKNYERKSPMDFAAQMMNEPGSGEHMPITRKQIDYMWVEPRDVPGNLRISIHCDTAWKSKERLAKGDYNVIQVWGHSVDMSGVVYYLEGHRSNIWRVEDFGDRLTAVIQRYRKEGRGPFVVTDEKGMGGKDGALEALVQNWCAQAGFYAPPMLLITRQGKKKEHRIREAAGYWADGKVRIVRGSSESESLVGEMLRIGVSANDDMADAAADVFHPEIYIPEIASNYRHQLQPLPPRRPGDDILQYGNLLIDDEDLRELYDQQVEKELQEMDRWGY